MNQFPTAFQFNERFLIEINTHLYSCQVSLVLNKSFIVFTIYVAALHLQWR